MRIKSIQVENYKSFLKSTVIELTSGFNVIVGKNNAGKTALAEALSLSFEDKPHRSISTKPQINSRYNDKSKIHVSFLLTSYELLEIFRNYLHNNTIFLPAISNEPLDNQLRYYLQASEVESLVTASIEKDKIISANFFIDAKSQSQKFTHSISIKYDRAIETLAPTANVLHADQRYIQTFLEVVRILKSRLYKFNAERLHVSTAPIDVKRVLSSDASNLASVLHQFHSRNSEYFKELNKYMNQIFPDIIQVTTPLHSNNTASIAFRPTNVNIKRDDLFMPLSESGTGIGQVLAILYVVLTAEYPQVIIIDEPQSFLHPGAVRKLFSILQTDFPQHQYIITTHSPIAVTSANPETILLVRKQNSISNVESIDTSKNEQLSSFLSEVGVRLSDVFGADNILWVEGATEEKCFPMILQKVAQKPLLGTAILGVLHTGDFEQKDKQKAKMTFEIYEKLSNGQGLVPPAVGFIFDQEGRTEIEQKDLSRQSSGDVKFLERRLYENYLLNVEAIAHVLRSDSGEDVGVEAINEWLDEHRWDNGYFNRKPSVKKEEANDFAYWLEKVHGAKLLKDLFNQLPSQPCDYQKTRHSVALTEWIIEHSPEDLREISDLLIEVLDRSSSKIS